MTTYGIVRILQLTRKQSFSNFVFDSGIKYISEVYNADDSYLSLNDSNIFLNAKSNGILYTDPVLFSTFYTCKRFTSLNQLKLKEITLSRYNSPSLEFAR